MQGVRKGGEPKPPRVIVYGPPKVGKSTFGSESPSPIFVPTEDGVNNVPVDQFGSATTWEDLIANITKVATETHEYKTLVLDTLNGAADLCAQFVCTKFYAGRWDAQKGAEGFLSFGKGWAATSEEIKPLLVMLDKCRDRGMTILLLAHTGIQSVKNPVLGDYTKFAPELDKKVWARISKWCDIIGRADFEYSVLGASEQKKGRALGTNKRTLLFGGSAAEDAGCRVGFELPEKINFSWADFASVLSGKGALSDEIRAAWEVLTPEESAKALKFLGIKSLDDLDSAAPQKLAQINNSLKNKTAPKAA